MGAPEGGLKQCAKGRGQDRTSGGGACVSKARFPFVRVGRQAAGWRPFLLKSATVSAGRATVKPVLISWLLACGMSIPDLSDATTSSRPSSFLPG
jgi:hypothetical protein